ncbi:iron complex transport system ATP-binding protein [Salinibacterium amurskyense]|uniref:Iron complex transport system ATP-binding protein n=1 Tax=Salinibacterium amurskyense TaxID=205941 RepID=A0A2M9D6V4_9MICO|nr:ABC transporter ATP-binding protein [Salinibacterium amurskyense]PJJ81233.1 iron complex transport system ATP-binding protein [Salinibacterium amurskyense]RLQ83251.1 ABC transporter ATP-binding protein [Salinibacterium amurskyense]GHD81219.1 ABC transporter ATPase [Salinibacterium amurskyense]
MITVGDLSVKYGQVAAVAGVSLSALDGGTLGLIGPNGSGKSTVLRAILGALDSAAGTIMIDEDDARALTARERSRRLAIVAQEEPSGLPLTAWDSVILGRSVHVSGWQSYRDEDERAAEQAMVDTGTLHLRDRSMDELSGGERQRVLIARALAQAASHLLLDEPTNHLDVRYQHELLTVVAGLPLCTVVVLHDLNLAARYCDQLVLLDGGTVVAAGDPASVLTPENLEPVYGIDVTRTDLDGVPQLLFTPR